MKNESKTHTFMETLEAQSQRYGVKLSAGAVKGLAGYYKLVDEWNSRLHLVAPCSPAEFATRHVLESLFLLQYLPPEAIIVDVGSGAGLPAIPCLIARPDIHATLIESSKKKSVFLREILNRMDLAKSAIVLAEPFEQVSRLTSDFVSCRAFEHFADKLAELIAWSPPASILLFYGGNLLRERLVELDVDFMQLLLPNSYRRFLFIMRRQ